MISRKSLLLLAIFCFIVGKSISAFPKTIRFQGRLSDNRGRPFQGKPTTQFKLFASPTAGEALWTSPQTVVDTNMAGLFSTELGPIPEEIFKNNEALFIEISVRDVGTFQILSPRQPFSSVPYSLMSQQARSADLAMTVADGAVIAGKLGDQAVQSGNIGFGVVQSTHVADDAISSRNILDHSIGSVDLSTDAFKLDNIPPQSIEGWQLVRGSITELEIATGAVHERHLADNSVTSDKIVNGSIKAEDINSTYGLVPSSAVIIWPGAVCPAGYQPFEALNGRFPYGMEENSYSGEQGKTGGSPEITGLTTTKDGAHTHFDDYIPGFNGASVPSTGEVGQLWGTAKNRTDTAIAQSYTLPAPGTLKSFKMYVMASTRFAVNVALKYRLSIYTDWNGAPDSSLFTSGEFTVTSLAITNSITVEPNLPISMARKIWFVVEALIPNPRATRIIDTKLFPIVRHESVPNLRGAMNFANSLPGEQTLYRNGSVWSRVLFSEEGFNNSSPQIGTLPFSFTFVENPANTVRINTSSTGNTLVRTDPQGVHYHSVNSDGKWLPPYLGVLFCQKK